MDTKKTCVQSLYGKCLAPSNPQPLENFWRDAARLDGLKGDCVFCSREKVKWQRANPHHRDLQKLQSLKTNQKFCSKHKSRQCVSPINPQPLENFRPQKGRMLGVKSVCRKCERFYFVKNAPVGRARAKKWRLENLERFKETKRKKMYGLEPGQFQRMLTAQNNKCALANCDVTHSEKRPLHIDHCHRTGNIRGLLCYGCNPGLGNFKDNPRLLEDAANYLRTHQNQPVIPSPT